MHGNLPTPMSGRPKNVDISFESISFINALLQYDPKKRISAEEALEHQWFKTAEFKRKDKVNRISPELAKELITNMTKYKSSNVLKCAVIAYLVHHLTNTEECMEASKLFTKIDLNSDGKIEKHELIRGFQKYWGMPEDEVKEKVDIIFANIDTDFNQQKDISIKHENEHIERSKGFIYSYWDI